MLTYLIEVSVCWLILFSLYYFFLRKETFFNANRFYLLFSLLLGLIIPWIMPLIQNGIASNIINMVSFTLPIEEISFETESTSQSGFVLTWWHLVMALYSLGVAFFTIQFSNGIYQIIRLKKHGQTISNGQYKLIYHSNISAPFSFGKWLFLPQNQLSKSDEEKIIQHELVHIQSQHSFDILLVEVLGILFWFNPLLRLFHTALKEVHEYAADQHVTRSIPVKNYGQLLLQQAFPDVELRLVHNFNQSQLKNRIKMMTKKRSSKSAIMKYALILPALFALTIVFSAYTLDGTSSGDPVYGEVDQMPTLKGCENSDQKAATKCSNQKIVQLVYSQVKYPKAAYAKSIEGLAVVSFVVSKEGKVKEVKIVKDLEEGCGQAAYDAVYTMVTNNTEWNAGVHKGKKVNVEMKLPVRFKMPKKKKE